MKNIMVILVGLLVAILISWGIALIKIIGFWPIVILYLISSAVCLFVNLCLHRTAPPEK
jgi:hypothetical protein